MTLVDGVLAICFMPHTPKATKFLTGEERAVLLHRKKIDLHGPTVQEDVGQEHFQGGQARTALLSQNTLFSSLTWFFSHVPLYLSTLENAALFSPHRLTDDRVTERLIMSANDRQSSWLHGNNGTASYRATEPLRLLRCPCFCSTLG
jgi:hypothetical protein